MKIATDPETLRIPAFMRKKKLRTQATAKPLVLTALDRKNAAKIKKEKVQKSRKSEKLQKKTCRVVSRPQRVRLFTPPEVAQKISAPREKSIGTMTHYYAKIQVGVIKLSGILSVGDMISYETNEGPYEQIVESMEIDRAPVFKAGKGKEIGLKLKKEAKTGGIVLKI